MSPVRDPRPEPSAPAARAPDTASRVRAHAWVSGRVQGVGFRLFAHHHAQRLGLDGFVRNLRDRRVEVAAEGPPAAVAALLGHVRQGPPGAIVSDVTLEWETPQGEIGFAIRANAHG